ncbi:MAG: FkbM family methyltransferase [Bacteroidia bacterium]|nr:FkbM family methyltransferase [Bacteroidia bacterium]
MLKEKIKDAVRKILWVLHIDITQNLRYDRQTIAVMKKVLKPESNCIDVGCHKGEMLDLMLQYAPQGKHFAFEPLPNLYKKLTERYRQFPNVTVSDIALCDEKGSTSFHYVVNAPAYSGIKQREYKKAPQIEVITVQTDKLDHVISVSQPVHFIKIDTEGGEYGVLKGAKALISRNKPVIIFECGIGASDYYETKPGEVFQLLRDCNLNVTTLQQFVKGGLPLTLSEFENQYYQKINYYFVAYPQDINP